MHNSANIDAIDRKILRQLQDNARLTNQELSEKVGLSPSPCLRRLRRLEADGVITGYSASIDEEKLGLPVAVFMSVKLDKQIDSALGAFEKEISKHPEIVDCWLMTGENDYLLRILAPGLREYEAFLTGIFTKIPGIASIQSSVSLRRVKSSQPSVAGA
ncbi:MAG: Lrp/AsnC family transcriptional regulator [Rhodobiaceae bacterium]|nr:Lrp/AsnC family transcriptional regulator [Rhodobiaceae bacterium]